MHGTSLIVFEIFAGIAFLTVLGTVIAVVMTKMFGAPEPGGSVEATLRRRYARGELTREQYLQMRSDLGLSLGDDTLVAGAAPRTERETAGAGG